MTREQMIDEAVKRKFPGIVNKPQFYRRSFAIKGDAKMAEMFMRFGWDIAVQKEFLKIQQADNIAEILPI